MEIRNSYGKAVVSVDILTINSNEMYQMVELRERIEQVLNSHRDDNVKNQYLSDGELKRLYAILRVFTKGHGRIVESAFDDMLKVIDDEEKQHQLDVSDDHASREF